VRRTRLLVAALGLLAAACAATADEPAPTLGEASGGETTVFDETRDAFSYSARNLGPAERDVFLAGKSLFQRPWVRAPASTEGGDGLGPTYTATACTGCHLRLGRGAVPEAVGAHALGLVARLPRFDGTRDPAYGAVLQPFALDGVPAEGKLVVAFEESVVTLGDGSRVPLRRPRVRVEGLAFGPLASGTEIDLRIAPQLVGLGLLEAIPAATLEGYVTANEAGGDGVRGALFRVPSPELGHEAIGRFGWRGEHATVRDFVAEAFAEDIGITTEAHPEEGCPGPQAACREVPHGGAPELSRDKLERVSFFARTVAVPARRDTNDAEVLRGERAFAALGCARCHAPRAVTGESTIPALARQTIAPYTDLLLHDLGDGLRGAGGAGLTRTPPLWGLGLHATVNGHRTFLHDGRARSPLEAIVWHGGEADGARRAFSSTTAAERTALLRFLESL